MADFSVRWKNFHGFADSDWVDFKPLTVFIGSNNSGKSSLIQPLLLLKQTAEGEGKEPNLITRGRLVNGGSFDDLTHNEERSFSFDVRYGKAGTESKPKHVGHYPPSRTKLVFERDDNGRSARITSYEVFDPYGRSMLRRTVGTKGNYGLAGVPRAVDKEEKSNEAAKRSLADRALRKLIRTQKPEQLSFYGGRLYSRAIRDLPHEALDKNSDALQLSESSAEYIRIVDFAGHALHHLLWEINYIGPLREQPERLYELSGEPPSDVGVKGENSAELVFRHSDAPFMAELNRWMGRFEFADRVRLESLSSSAFSLLVDLPGGPTEVNFADVGFGMSQVLPLVVQALLAETGERLIAAQPEIHLNPKLQGVLGDLLVETVLRGASIAVETHSEHLLLRLRRLVAEGVMEADELGLYFVERVRGLSRVRRVAINSNGHIDPKEWPRGFFGDSLAEAMALASAQAKARASDG